MRIAVHLAVMAATLATIVVASPVLADPGDLDAAFHGDGEQVVSYSTGDESALDLIVDGGSRPVLVGTANGDWTLTRFRTNGQLDPDFSGDGRLTVDLGGIDTAIAGALQGTKLLVAGRSGNAGALARIKTDGTRDRTFSGDGRLRIAVPGSTSTQLDTVATAADGGVVGAGITVRTNGDDQGVVVRTTASGALDITFSGDGIRLIDSLKPARVVDVTALPNGKILVLLNDPSAILLRLKPGGALDTTFGDNGSIRPPVSMKGRAFTRDGSRILVVGTTGNDTLVVARFLADGTPDTTLQNGDAVVLISDHENIGPLIFVDDVAVDALHRILVAGSTNDNEVLFRLTATAALDPAFGFGRGFVEVGGPDIDGFTGVEIDGSGRIVAGGTLGGATPGTGDQHVVRLLSE